MRFSAGHLKGRRINCPARRHGGPATRPTTGLVREALFNILAEKIPGCSFLDLFAGTGSVGLEAASRGAALVFLVENNHRILPCLRKNRDLAVSALSSPEIPEPPEIKLLEMDAAKAAARLARDGAAFDFVFADPPYSFDPALTGRIVDEVTASLLNPAGLLVVQYHRDLLIGDTTGGPFTGRHGKLVDTRAYGSDRLAFFEAATP